jgi:hypothetical protein
MQMGEGALQKRFNRASASNSALVGVQQWVDEGSLVPESSE